MRSKNSIIPKAKPRMVMKETFYRTRRFFHRALMNLRSFISQGHYQKLPKNPAPEADPIFSCGIGNKVSSSLLEMDSFYRGVCEHWDSMENVKKRDGHLSLKVETKAAETRCSKRSISVADFSVSEELKEHNDERNNVGMKQGKSNYQSVNALAQKMRELEMMDVKDMDHVLDVEEVLHYYSRLTCPAYVEIVDKFFMDIYSELNVPEQSRSVDSSLRSLDPLKL